MHQIYKRVWPSSQRDTVFLSHIREISAYDAGERQENEVGRPWIVCNYSLDHPDAPVWVFLFKPKPLSSIFLWYCLLCCIVLFKLLWQWVKPLSVTIQGNPTEQYWRESYWAVLSYGVVVVVFFLIINYPKWKIAQFCILILGGNGLSSFSSVFLIFAWTCWTDTFLCSNRMIDSC